MRCQQDGKSGWKWGKSGKCYTGPNAKEKALAQGRAIEANKNKTSAHDLFVDKVNKIADKHR
jgi:hypothetical protein